MDRAIISLGDESQLHHNTINSQLTQFQTSNDAGFQSVITHLTDNTQSSSLNSLKLDDISRQQNRIVDELSSKVCSRLRQVDERLQQMQACHITYGPATRTPRNISKSSGNHNNAYESIVYWCWNYYRLPFGYLRFTLRRSRKTQNTSSKIVAEKMHSEISVTFAAPIWLSKLAIDFMAKIDHNLTSREWFLGARLKPMVINSDSMFREALENGNVESLTWMFQTGRSQPSDYVIGDNGFPCPWYIVSHAVQLVYCYN